jgi:hypothetical protein
MRVHIYRTRAAAGMGSALRPCPPPLRPPPSTASSTKAGAGGGRRRRTPSSKWPRTGNSEHDRSGRRQLCPAFCTYFQPRSALHPADPAPPGVALSCLIRALGWADAPRCGEARLPRNPSAYPAGPPWRTGRAGTLSTWHLAFGHNANANLRDGPRPKTLLISTN